MKNRGFVSWNALIWYSVVVVVFYSALQIINHYSQALENIILLEKESLLELEVIAITKNDWYHFETEDYCELIEEVEVCWCFKSTKVEIVIEYPEYRKTFIFKDEDNSGILVGLSQKVDK